MMRTTLFFVALVGSSALSVRPADKPADKPLDKPADRKPADKPANRKPAAFRGVSLPGIENAQMLIKVNATEYPCGRPSKVKAFEMYRENLLSGVCSLPTANGMNCEASLECPLNQFFTEDCMGMDSAPKDVCDVCLYAGKMANASIGGTPLDGTWFYTYKKFFQDYMGDSQLYRTMFGRYMLGKEIMCAAMIMVTDKCATGTNLPSCFQFSGRWFTGREHEGGDVNYGEELAAYGEEDKWANRDEASGTVDRTEINNILQHYGTYPEGSLTLAQKKTKK
jgi:hypothetical protein